jgi:hypothetical protein
MRVGGATFESISGVPVFDFTDEPEAPVQGMLGTRFLLGARAAVDFTTDKLRLGVAALDEPDAARLRRGYAAVPMRVGEDFRVTIDARFPALDRVLAITPSTVGGALTLHRPLFEGVMPMAPTESPDRSPSGTSPDVFMSEGVELVLGEATLSSAATFEDLAEYANLAVEELASFGMLGFDWMRERAAILDYANRTLYFKP